MTEDEIDPSSFISDLEFILTIRSNDAKLEFLLKTGKAVKASTETFIGSELVLIERDVKMNDKAGKLLTSVTFRFCLPS